MYERVLSLLYLYNFAQTKQTRFLDQIWRENVSLAVCVCVHECVYVFVWGRGRNAESTNPYDQRQTNRLEAPHPEDPMEEKHWLSWKLDMNRQTLIPTHTHMHHTHAYTLARRHEHIYTCIHAHTHTQLEFRTIQVVMVSG